MKTFLITCLVASSLAAPAAIPQSSTSSSTKNDVTDGVCRPVTYIFARGTTETGNMGSTVGPALESALESAFGSAKVATQGVTYPADTAGAVSGATDPADAEGAKTMASLAKQALSSCPTTKIILAGYSQGAEQVHGALQDLSTDQVTVRTPHMRFLLSLAVSWYSIIDSLDRSPSRSVTLSSPRPSRISMPVTRRSIAPQVTKFVMESLSSLPHISLTQVPMLRLLLSSPCLL